MSANRKVLIWVERLGALLLALLAFVAVELRLFNLF